MNVLSAAQRSQVIGEITQNGSMSLAVIGFDNGINGEISKFQEYGQQIVRSLKEILAKIDPKSESVSSSECMKLVI